MKKMFENPEVELEKFQVEETLTASVVIGDGEPGDIEEGL